MAKITKEAIEKQKRLALEQKWEQEAQKAADENKRE